MTRRIKLTFNEPEIEKYLGRNTLRLNVVASDAEDMPAAIFLHQKTLVDQTDSDQQDEFVAICSPYDLSDYPVDEPDSEQFPAFFRKTEIDILLPGVGLFVETKDEIEAQVRHLVHLLDQLETLADVEEVWIPEAPTE